MRFLGLEISRIKNAAVGATTVNIPSRTLGWFPLFRSPAQFQTDDRPMGQESLLAYFAVYACISLIAGDIAKMHLKLMEEDIDGNISTETYSPSFSPVLGKPNRYQTRIKFIEWWITCKLIHGNTYALKERDRRGVVTALYVLDPTRVIVLVTPDGSVFYQLAPDNISGLRESVVVPAREIIHDVMCPLFHPLFGVSPLMACASASQQGLQIQATSTQFFASGSQPSGILTSPNPVKPEDAERYQKNWEENFAGAQNIGRVAVLGGGMTYTPMSITARDAQLIEQLRWTAEVVCGCFHVPMHKINIGSPPHLNSIESLDQQYYSQCLQTHIESLEALLNEGLELPDRYTTEFELDDMMRMDSTALTKTLTDGVKGGIRKPNEARQKLNLPPVPGGDSCYLQQQDFSLEALAARDAAGPAPASITPPSGTPSVGNSAMTLPPQVDRQRLNAKLRQRAA